MELLLIATAFLSFIGGYCLGKSRIFKNPKTLKTMESNKSKGVEELIQWAATKRKENRESRDITRSPYREIHDGKEKAFGEMVDYLLAHSQQSEATLTDHATSIGTPIQTTAAASEGVEDRWKYEVAKEAVDHAQLPAGWTAEATADGKIRITPPPKAEGVEERRKLAETIREHLNSVGYALGEDTTSLIAQVLEIDGERIGFTLARPQQSEGVEDEIERYKQWVADLQSGMYVNCVYCGHRYGREDETPAAMADVLKAHIEQCPEHPLSKALARIKELESKAGGVGATDSICGDLEDRQAAERETDKSAARYWFATGQCNPDCDFDEEYGSLFNVDGSYADSPCPSQPSEPAALKEPQGSAPTVVITDGEIDYAVVQERVLGVKHDYDTAKEEYQEHGDFERLKTSTRAIHDKYFAATQFKGKNLSDGEVEGVAKMLWNKYQEARYGHLQRDEIISSRYTFTAALKEFASLLTNRKS